MHLKTLLYPAVLAVTFATCTSITGLPVAYGQNTTHTPERQITLGMNKGTLIRLDRPAANVFIANPKIADVQVRSPQLIYIFGTGEGETTLFAVDSSDRVLYSANVSVANNLDQIRQMLKVALPTSEIDVQTFSGIIFLSGAVPSPAAIEEAGRLVQGFVGEKQVIVNKLTTATPVQVNLQVKIAEVSRSILKEVGANIATRDQTGGFLFNLSRGRNFVNITGNPGSPTRYNINVPLDGRTAIAAAGKLFGLDAATAIDALAQEGLVTILAEPNLTSVSGETASFLAGGEFAIPVPDSNGTVVIQYKEYGVGLAFTPTVLSGERITMRVRPEVSELSQAGSITVNNITVPGITTRRAETTVELGSGQSFMIAGLLRNSTGSSVDKMPFLGDLPILGSLFKSDRFQRNETELVIVVTPYLVQPTNAQNIKLPTDGYKAPNDLERWLLGKTFKESKPSPSAPSQGTPAKPAVSVSPGFSNK